MKTLMKYLANAKEASKDSPYSRAKQLVEDINSNFSRHRVTASLLPSLTEVTITQGHDLMTIKAFTEGKYTVDGSCRLVNEDEMYVALFGYLGTLNANIKQHLSDLSETVHLA